MMQTALYGELPLAEERKLVTMQVSGQLLGISVAHVRDVLRSGRIAPIPLASPEIFGAMNLRGRIVTVIDLRTKLGLAPMQGGSPMFVVVEHGNEYFSFRVDSVGDVLAVAADQIEKSPSNLTNGWQDVCSGVHRLPNELLLIVDIAALLSTRGVA